ncbi:MAG: hypothetical protein HC769_31975 [Cyanobacteria bacterium CRU_2_1]|nr:hypothetical protein [Cyanobacteria bacterium CRU_2_1]
MTPIQEVFLERHWDDAAIACQHCNIRKADLEAHGFICTIENLFTVNGDRVFILVATPPNATELRGEFLKSDRISPSKPSPQKRNLPTRNPAGTSRPRTIPQFETR